MKMTVVAGPKFVRLFVTVAVELLPDSTSPTNGNRTQPGPAGAGNFRGGNIKYLRRCILVEFLYSVSGLNFHGEFFRQGPFEIFRVE